MSGNDILCRWRYCDRALLGYHMNDHKLECSFMLTSIEHIGG
jgi:hypothetical protein